MQTTFITLLLAAILALFAFEVQATPVNGIPCDQCNPIPNSPAAVTCDITTSCITTNGDGAYHCACRAGYKSAFPDNSAYNSYRLPFIGQEYRVFVRPGVVCNTLCKDWQLGPAGCQEIPVRNECLKK